MKVLPSKFILIFLAFCLCMPVFASGVPNKKFVRWLENRMEEKKIPGVSIAVIKEYKIDWVAGYGVRDILSEKPITEWTLFQAGSLSKPVTAVGVLKSAEDGKLDIDVSINDILKSWQVPSGAYFQNEIITLREILSHTSGVNVPGFLGYASDDNKPTLMNVLKGTRPANTPPIRITGIPGEAIQFSGGGYVIAQQVLTDIYGQPFNQIMDKLVFSPLGMTNSTFDEPLPESLNKNIASPYYPDYKSVPGGPHTYIAQAAAGLWTTPFDMAKFTISIMRSLKGNPYQILTPNTAKLLIKPQLDDVSLGFIVKVNKYGESTQYGKYFMIQGQTEGYRSLMIARASGGFGVIIMTNMSQPGNDIMTGKVKDDWEFMFELERKIADMEGWY